MIRSCNDGTATIPGYNGLLLKAIKGDTFVAAGLYFAVHYCLVDAVATRVEMSLACGR
jgi:hypothetical protein